MPPDYPPSAPALPQPRRRRLRVSLRGLMVLVLLVGGGLGWFIHRARVQRDAVAAIGRAGGFVRYDSENFAGPAGPSSKPRWPPRWLYEWFGPHYFDTVVYVQLGERSGDEEMAHVAQFSRLRSFLDRRSNVTDAGLARLSDLTDLERITIEGHRLASARGSTVYLPRGRAAAFGRMVPGQPPSGFGQWGLVGGLAGAGRIIPGQPHVTGAFLAGCARLTRLKVLSLGGIPVRDADLAGIARLDRLRDLNLDGSGITDAGMAHLIGLTHLAFLNLDDNPITGAGLAKLRDMSALHNLSLQRTRVGDLEPLGGARLLQRLSLRETPVTDPDLTHLAHLTGLEYLSLRDTAITDAGLARLAGLSRLEALTLAGTGVTDAGLAELTKLPRLWGLNLARTAMTDVGLDHLRLAPLLKLIDVRGTAVTDAGLDRALGWNTLRHLDIDEGRVPPQRLARMRQIQPGIGVNSFLLE